MPDFARLVRTTTFRLALVYLVLFLASVGVVLGYVYWRTAILLEAQTDATIEAEVQGLAEQYRAGGLGRLMRTIAGRSREEGSSVYLLVDPDRRRLAGNLASEPDEREIRPGWVEFDYGVSVGDGIAFHTARARLFRLAGDFRLLVGRDIEALRRFDASIRGAFVWAFAITIVLGVLGGVLVSRQVLTRIESMTQTSRTIMSGDLSGRIPLSGSGDELDRLAENLNRMLEQIERLMGATREVTDNIAHDLRTPLTRLKARLEDALRGDGHPDREALAANLEEVDRLIATFNALLSIAHLESGSGGQLPVIDISAVIRDAAELYEPAAEEEGFAYHVEVEAGLGARADRQLIGQAIANLVDNAIKYGRSETDDRPAISVRARRVGDEVEIAVSDSGPGIDEADRVRAVDRLVRLERSRTVPGSGLGLSLVAAIAWHHGARFTLEGGGGAQGEGLVARLVLPAVPLPAPTTSGKKTQTDAGPDTAGSQNTL